ncbi:MAG: hypothetical protein LHW56_08655 [Candidatus Cloacimonetes bacterium]|nr:hypothetical protein [Candidatus Cloacimonadota bacterium]MDY0172964.1 hypothetical protein [Candidatus Cloacimonadaceae bacterium]
MKWLVSLLLCFGIAYAYALESSPDLISLPELLYEEGADNASDEIYQSFKPFHIAGKMSVYLRDESYLLTHLLFKQEGIVISGGIKSGEWQSGNLQAKFYDRVIMGNFRTELGEGLVFARAKTAPRLLNPPHPQSFAPQGLALNLAYKNWSMLAIASVLERDVKITEEKISAMPLGKREYLSQSKEKIGSAALWYAGDQYHLGALLYQQRYDRAFVKAEQDSFLQVGSFFGRAALGTHKFGLESALQKGKASLKAEWEMQSGSFWQRWRYGYIDKYQRPAYAARALRLSSLDEREEISAEASVQLIPNLKLEAGAVLCRRLGLLTDPDWLSQSSIRLCYRDKDSFLMASLKLIDRQILSAIDSSYVSSIPLHYRFQIGASQEIKEFWEIAFSARYHYQEKAAAFSSGSWWQHSFGYHNERWKLLLGYTIWNSANFKMIVPNDSDLGYESLGSNAIRIEGKAAYKLTFGKIEASMRQGLKEPYASSIDLHFSLHR